MGLANFSFKNLIFQIILKLLKDYSKANSTNSVLQQILAHWTITYACRLTIVCTDFIMISGNTLELLKIGLLIKHVVALTWPFSKFALSYMHFVENCSGKYLLQPKLSQIPLVYILATVYQQPALQ